MGKKDGTQDPGGNGGNDDQGPEMFSQEQVDRIMGKTRTESRERTLGELTQKYGDLEALKEAAEAWAKQQEKQKTELEQQQGAHDKEKGTLETAVADAEATINGLESQLRDQVLRGAIGKVAADMGCDPDVAWAMVDRSALEVDEDGKAAGVKAAMEALKKEKPGLFGAPGMPGSPAARPAGAGSAEKLREAVRERLEKPGRYRM